MSRLCPRSWRSRFGGGVIFFGGNGDAEAGGCGSGRNDCLAKLYMVSGFGFCFVSSYVLARGNGWRIAASLLPRLCS